MKFWLLLPECLFSVNNEVLPVSLSLISQWRVLTGWLTPLYYKLLAVFRGIVWVKSAKKIGLLVPERRLIDYEEGTKTIWNKCSRNLFLKPSSVFSRKDIFNNCESNFFIAYFLKLFDKKHFSYIWQHDVLLWWSYLVGIIEKFKLNVPDRPEILKNCWDR